VLAVDGAIEIEFASSARMRITGAVDAVTLAAAVAALADGRAGSKVINAFKNWCLTLGLRRRLSRSLSWCRAIVIGGPRDHPLISPQSGKPTGTAFF
jgi:hypothetical protein